MLFWIETYTNVIIFLLHNSDGQTIMVNQSVTYLGLELNQYLDGEQIVLVNSKLKFLYR